MTNDCKLRNVIGQKWVLYGPFSFRSFSSKHGKILVYVARVHSALLSGLESQVLDAGKYQQLNSLVLKHGRKLMQGKACSKQVMPDGTSRIFHARPKPFGAGWACVLWISSCRLGGLFGISSWLKTFRIIFAFSWPFLAGSGVKLATQLTQPAGFCRLPIPGLSSSWLIFIHLQISATKWGGLGIQYRLPASIFLYKQEGLCPPFCIWNHFVVDSFQIMHFHFVVVYCIC